MFRLLKYSFFPVKLLHILINSQLSFVLLTVKHILICNKIWSNGAEAKTEELMMVFLVPMRQTHYCDRKHSCFTSVWGSWDHKYWMVFPAIRLSNHLFLSKPYFFLVVFNRLISIWKDSLGHLKTIQWRNLSHQNLTLDMLIFQPLFHYNQHLQQCVVGVDLKFKAFFLW